MQNDLNRRDFSIQTSAGIAGMLMGSLGYELGASPPAEEKDKKDKTDMGLVLLGLNALARSPEMNYFADGHRGASLVAAHLLCVENKLDEATHARIVELFKLNWSSTKLCAPFPDAEANKADITKIGDALREGGEVLRQVGHNAIFAMLAIRAFRLLPSAATPERIDGVCRLIRSFTPWRDGKPDPKVDPPPFAESQAASRFVLKEALASIDRFVGFGQGFAGHMLTFGQALIELAAMGDVELAESCRTPFRKYVTVTRQGPAPKDRRIPDHKPSQLRPKDKKYWQKRGDHSLGIGHVFKYPYSYYDLLRRANDPELAAAWDKKAYHLF